MRLDVELPRLTHEDAGRRRCRVVTLSVDEAEIVAVLGRNGAGKSTLLRTISRIDATVRSGAIVFDGHDLVRASTVQGVRYGCLHVPKGRQLFTDLSVDDNVRLGAFSTDRSTLEADLAAVYARFPALAERRAQTAFSLSGGEQQMLAIGRALMAKPKLLMLDEPSTGLAPQIVEQFGSSVIPSGVEGSPRSCPSRGTC